MKQAIAYIFLCFIIPVSTRNSEYLKIAESIIAGFNKSYSKGEINNLGGLYTKESTLNFWEQHQNRDTLFTGAEKIMEFYEQMIHRQLKVNKIAHWCRPNYARFPELEMKGGITIVESWGTRSGQFYAIIKSSDDPRILYEEIIIPY